MAASAIAAPLAQGAGSMANDVFGGGGIGAIAGKVAYGITSQVLTHAVAGGKATVAGALSDSFNFVSGQGLVDQSQQAASGQQGEVFDNAYAANANAARVADIQGSGDFARADGSIYRSESYVQEPYSGSGLRFGSGTIGLQAKPDVMAAMDEGIVQARDVREAQQALGESILKGIRDTETAASLAAEKRARIAAAQTSKPNYQKQDQVDREGDLQGSRTPEGNVASTQQELNRFKNARSDIMSPQARMTDLALLSMRGDAVKGMPASFWDSKAQEYKDTTLELGQRFARDGIYNGFKMNAIDARRDVTSDDTNHMVSVLIDSGGAAAVGTALGTRSISYVNGPALGVPSNRPSYLTSDEFNRLPRTGSIDPRTIRYSQDSAGENFKKPFGSVDGFVRDLANGAVNPASVEPIRIVIRDGKVFTLDNRRLYGFEKAEVPVQYVKLDSIPKRELFKFTTQNDGTSIVIRRGQQ